MRAGDLRHRLTLQQNQAARGAYNEAPPAWVTLATLWGAVSSISARQFVEQARTQGEITHKVVIRYRPGILPQRNRLLYKNRVLIIEGVLDADEARRQLTLMCREVVNG